MEDLREMLTPLLEGTDVPSLAAAVVVGSEARAAGAVGVRKRGNDTPVTVNDKYHIGSCVKAMTATLAGVLVERGVLRCARQRSRRSSGRTASKKAAGILSPAARKIYKLRADCDGLQNRPNRRLQLLQPFTQLRVRHPNRR